MTVANLSSVYYLIGSDLSLVTLAARWKQSIKIKLFVFLVCHWNICLLPACA